jgi:CDP-paratose 2-epimerase
MRILITGGCGFLGSNLAEAALRRGDALAVVDDLSRLGSRQNLAWLSGRGKFAFTRADVRSPRPLLDTVRSFRPDAVFHLAGQVAMTTSLKDPRRDFETNVLGGFNALEAVRRFAPKAVVVYSSTNKVYGDLGGVRFKKTKTRYVSPAHPRGFDESLPLNFQSPYGCSKGAVDQYMLDYHRMFGLRTIVFRHSSIFGGRQFSTFDQGWIGWFVSQAVAASRGRLKGPIAVAGDGRQVRDVLFASDIARCYRAALTAGPKAWGQAFNIGGGMENSLSLVELFDRLESLLGVRLPMRNGPWRESDQKVFVADTGKARRLLGWRPEVSVDQGLAKMVEWVSSLER